MIMVAGVGSAVSLPAAEAAGCAVFFDSDADGSDDLALGTPGEDVQPGATNQVDAGTVTLVHGDSAGHFGSTDSELITQESLGLVSQAGDRFGAAVATADLNGDGCADLAIGSPGESGGAGAVVVVWGSTSGLDLGSAQELRQGTAPVLGFAAEAGDGFGSSLAAAGSQPTGGAAALWVGAPGEDVGSLVDAGLVVEVKTLVGGLLGAAGVTGFTQNTAGVPGTAEKGDKFGRVLSGGARTLLVGVPDEDISFLTDAGSYSAFSLASRTWTAYSQDTAGVPGAAEAGDRFGASLSHGAGCRSATDESWAVGSPGEDIASIANAGSVTLRDRSTGRGTSLQQGLAGIPGAVEAGDSFGDSLVDAGAGILAVGTPREDIGAIADAGSVTLITLGCVNPGTTNAAVVAESSISWNQGTTGVPDGSESGDRFAASLGVSAVGVSGPEIQLRLIVGAPGEPDGTFKGSGAVIVFDSAASGLTTTGSQFFGQGSPSILGEPGTNDGFGGSLDSSNALIL